MKQHNSLMKVINFLFLVPCTNMQIVCRFLNSAHNWFKFCLVFGGNCSWGLKGNLYNFLMGGECATRGSGSFETCIIVCFKQRIVSTVQLSGTYCSSPCRVSSLMVVRLCNIGNSFFRISFVSISFWGSKLERKNIDVFHEFTGFKPRWSPEFFFQAS